MIEVSLQTENLSISQSGELVINLINIGHEVLTNIVFALKIPPSVFFQSGSKQVEIPQLVPNKIFKHVIRIVPPEENLILTIYNFSYRGSSGKITRPDDTKYSITVKPAPLPTKPPVKPESKSTKDSQSTATSKRSVSSNISLSGPQCKILQEALINAFPTMTSLEQMLLYGLDKNLRGVAGEGSLQDVVFKLLQAANAQGWLQDLVRAACDEVPGNLKLKDIAKEILTNV